MTNDCSIVKDLLALYSEDMVSEETAEFIADHLESCEECSKEFRDIKNDGGFSFKRETAPIKDVKKKIIRKRIAAAVLAVLLAVTILITGYALLSTREYFEYSDDLMTVYNIPVNGSDETEYAAKRTVVVFNQKVTGCSYYISYEPELDKKSGLYDGYVCHIEAWTSPWDRLVCAINEKLGINGKGAEILALEERDSSSRYGNYSIYYSPNNGQSEINLSDKSEMNGYALPRLVLNYYLIIAVSALIVAAVVLVIFRKKEKIKKIMTYVFFVPLSYIISQLAVMGFDATTYSLTRDLRLIAFLAVLILCILISGYKIIQVRKEIKEINRQN